MVTTNILFLLPLEDNARYFMLSGDDLQFVTKDGRRISAVEEMSRGPKFSFLLPNLAKENIINGLKLYYNSFMRDAQTAAAPVPLSGINKSLTFSAQKSGLGLRTLQFRTGESAPLLLWLIAGLTLFPDDPAFINRIRTRETVFKGPDFDISDLEAAVGGNPGLVK